MGCCSSKTDEEGDDAPTYQMKHIYYDFEGNLRCGHVSNDKDEELRQVTLGDAISAKLKEEDGTEWFIVDTDWFNSWMAFVHFDRNSSPQPGPCRNDRLIRFNARTGQWVPRPFLKATDKRTNGNYSRISEALWDVFKDNYPGSGPEIKYTYYKKHHEKRKRQVTLSADHKEIIVVDEGDDDTKDLYPPQYWVINQEQCGVQKNENGPSLSGEEGEIARSSSCGLIIGDEEEEGGRMKKRGVYHQLVDVKQTALSTEDIDLSDDDGSKGGREESKVNSGYESMVDCTITSADRKNILSFFGSQGEDLDFHVSKDEVISEKYERGLGPVGKEENKDDGPMTIAPAVWLFGESNQVL